MKINPWYLEIIVSSEGLKTIPNDYQLEIVEENDTHFSCKISWDNEEVFYDVPRSQMIK